MDNNKVSVKNIFILTGAFCAYYIGAGFASGQEILQFYPSFGIKGFFGLAISLLIFGIFAYNIQVVCKREQDVLQEPTDILKYYFGTKIGKGAIVLLIAVLFGECVMMVSGAGAVFEEYFGLPNYLGRICLLVLMVLTIILGLDRLVDVIGVIGPVIVLFMLIVAVVSIVKAPETIAEGSRTVETMDFTKGGSNWLIGGAKYAGNVLITVMPIWIINGRKSANLKEARITTFTELAALAVACVLMVIAQLTNISIVGGTQIPNLALAKTYTSAIAPLFAIILLLGIYTTVAAEGWYLIRKFAEEKTKRYYLLTLLLAVLIFFITGFVPFDQIVNFLYTVVFWIGFLLLAIIIVRQILRKMGRGIDERILEAIKNERKEA